MIFIKGHYRIHKDPFVIAKEAIWLNASKIKQVEVIAGLGAGYVLAVVRHTGAAFVVETFNKHRYGAYNFEDADKARAKLEKLLEGNYRPETDCGFEYHIVGD